MVEGVVLALLAVLCVGAVVCAVVVAALFGFPTWAAIACGLVLAVIIALTIGWFANPKKPKDVREFVFDQPLGGKVSHEDW